MSPDNSYRERREKRQEEREEREEMMRKEWREMLVAEVEVGDMDVSEISDAEWG